jgi:hypothetical protein
MKRSALDKTSIVLGTSDHIEVFLLEINDLLMKNK